MVTIREKIDYQDLKVSVEPIEKKSFYLTGDMPSFKAIIENPTSKKRYGKLFFRWRLVNLKTQREVRFELKSFSKREYKLPKEWLYREGIATYELIVMPKSPEDYVNQPPIGRLSPHLSIHPLCSYYVRDKDLYKYEESYRRAMRLYSLVIVGLTIVNLIFLYGPQLIGLIKGVLNCQ